MRIRAPCPRPHHCGSGSVLATAPIAHCKGGRRTAEDNVNRMRAPKRTYADFLALRAESTISAMRASASAPPHQMQSTANCSDSDTLRILCLENGGK